MSGDDRTYDEIFPATKNYYEPYLSKDNDGSWSVSPGQNGITVDVMSNTKIVIDKLFGPLSASPVRIYLQYDKVSPGEWVVEYQNPKTDEWEEKARWNCQENWPENENDDHRY